ncbi:hypothetical protein OJ998_22225 [Solirubrobacter taibaiensis]|nr:hypothetical protein [Solirubrobacter taibaiensis]
MSADACGSLERIAVNEAVVAYGVRGTDGDRSCLAVTDRDHGLYLLGSDRLDVLHRWRLGAEAIGSHAVRVTDRVALISESAAVVLLDADGRPVWRHRHPAWKQGDFESGCAWFDEEGTPFAVVPASDYSGCEVVALRTTLTTTMRSSWRSILTIASPCWRGRRTRSAPGPQGLGFPAGQTASRAGD